VKVSEPQRLFLAVDLDSATRALLRAHVNEHLGPDVPGRPVPPRNWHITLRFIGRATPVEVDRLTFEVAEHIDTLGFVLRFGGLGAFPRARSAAVLWLGLRSGTSQTTEVAAACEAGAAAAGFSGEGRPFHPHLTLSRIRPARDVQHIVEALPVFDVSMSVTEVTLFESHLGEGAARYRAVDRFPLTTTPPNRPAICG
jgi:2'-5' RNA ligase